MEHRARSERQWVSSWGRIGRQASASPRLGGRGLLVPPRVPEIPLAWNDGAGGGKEDRTRG